MKKLWVYCTDIKTLKICNKYSEDGLDYQDEEYSGYLNFKGKEDFHEFLEETKNCEDLSSDGLFFNSNIFEKDGKYYEETNGKRVEIIGYDPVPIDCVPESWIENYPEHPCSP